MKLFGKVMDVVNGTVALELKDVENDTFIHKKLIQVRNISSITVCKS